MLFYTALPALCQTNEKNPYVKTVAQEALQSLVQLARHDTGLYIEFVNAIVRSGIFSITQF